MKRVLAAVLLVLVGAACRQSALASGETRDARKAMCAATHGVPRILLAYHSQKIGRLTAIGRFHNIADVIDDNATGRYGAHLHDLAAAIHVFSVVTLHRGDTSDAYRDLRALRESLPHQKNCQK